jgi:hypothetical protein
MVSPSFSLNSSFTRMSAAFPSSNSYHLGIYCTDFIFQSNFITFFTKHTDAKGNIMKPLLYAKL